MPEAHRFDLRIPLDLHEMLLRASTEQDRSLNREIIFRLRRSFVGEVASARTRERAGAIGLSHAEDTPDASHDRSPSEEAARLDREALLDEERVAAEHAEQMLSLPDSERRERHERCRKRAMHHIYHGGKPCPECGYPT